MKRKKLELPNILSDIFVRNAVSKIVEFVWVIETVNLEFKHEWGEEVGS